MLFLSSSETEILDASTLYLWRMRYFYWAFGILDIARFAMQGSGYSGRTVFGGVVEMIAHCVVALGFVPMFGCNEITFADQTAWMCADVYIVTIHIFVVRKIERQLRGEEPVPESRVA